MNDLSNLDWSSSAAGAKAKPPPMNPPSYPSLRASPSPFSSGRSTPNQPPGGGAAASKPAPSKAPQDSFSNLMNFGPAKSNQKLSLAERQAQLEAEKRKKDEERRKQAETQGQFWDTLGSRGSSVSPALQKPPVSNGASNDDDDLFAAFDKDTKVDNASHYPPPESQRSTPANGPVTLNLSDPHAWGISNGGGFEDEDDDPFGLSELKPSNGTASMHVADDDDFLGDLGRPVDEVRQKQQASYREPGKPIEDDEDDSSDSEDEVPQIREPRANKDPFDLAVAQLVDYGFSVEEATRGLVESGSGYNADAAANWLLEEAHRKSKAKAAQGRDSPATVSRPTPPSQPERRDSRSPARGEADLAKSAAAVGNSIFKTANSLWKTGQKKMQQAVSEFQQEGDPSQPKWMRDAQLGRAQDPARASATATANATDEALMLESGGRPKPVRTNGGHAPDSRESSKPSSRGLSPAQHSSSRNNPVPRWQQQATPSVVPDSKSRLSKLAADDDSFSSYSSPNRRKKATPPPQVKQTQPEPDLLFNSREPGPAQSLPQRPAPQSVRRPSPPMPKATPRPTRQIPTISPTTVQNSNKHRLDGTSHFKRGDYAAAHASYSSSLSGVPDSHPLVILLLTNRALTALKTGEPRRAVDDADTALKLIGPGNGQGETVLVKSESGQDEHREMRDLYGKALSRKAEALEQMEKWADAVEVWHQCVESNIAGATAIKGRQRCQDALRPKPKATPKPAAVKPRPKPSALASLAPQKSSEAVTRLREANEAAAKEDDEKFALTDKIEARVEDWRGGKRSNLRALLGSLDNVLWENCGWKKVGMHELVAVNKVKISYMKAIGKTHPDKLPQDANTEVRLIAGLVFSTLNESWDKFKAENGL